MANITRNDILQKILTSQDQGIAYANSARMGNTWSPELAQNTSAAYQEKNRRDELMRLLNSGGWDSESSSASGNPFGVGANGGAPTVDTSNAFGSSAPTMSTSNRFEAGLGDAEGRLRSLLDNPDSINQSAAYKFRVKQGEEAIQRQMGAKGMLNSGNRLMELTKYGQDMGSQEYDAQAGRLSNLLGNYSQSWLGDKNANTSRFSAESGAWLGDKNANTSRFSASSNAWNTAQANADRNRYQMGMLSVEQNKPQSGGGTVRLGGGSSGPIQHGTLSSLGQTPWEPFSAPVDMSPQPGTMAYNDWVSAKNTRQTY